MGSDFQVRFTDKPITPYAWIKPLDTFCIRCGLQEILNTLDLLQQGSDRGYDPVELLEGFFTIVILGESRFAGYYQTHGRKAVRLYYDRAGNARRNEKTTLAEQFKIDLESLHEG